MSKRRDLPFGLLAKTELKKYSMVSIFRVQYTNLTKSGLMLTEWLIEWSIGELTHIKRHKFQMMSVVLSWAKHSWDTF